MIIILEALNTLKHCNDIFSDFKGKSMKFGQWKKSQYSITLACLCDFITNTNHNKFRTCTLFSEEVSTETIATPLYPSKNCSIKPYVLLTATNHTSLNLLYTTLHYTHILTPSITPVTSTPCLLSSCNAFRSLSIIAALIFSFSSYGNIT